MIDPIPAPLKRTIQADSMLMHDMLRSTSLEVSSREGAVALFANPFRGGAIEALVLQTDPTHGDVLRHLQRTPGGWIVRDPAAVPIAANSVVTATDPDGRVWAFYTPRTHGNAGVMLQLTGAQTWAVQTQSPALTADVHLRVTYAIGVPSQVPIVYAWDEKGGLIMYEWSPGGTWIGRAGSIGHAVRDLTLLPLGSSDVLSTISARLKVCRPGDDQVYSYLVTPDMNGFKLVGGVAFKAAGLRLVIGPAGDAMALGVAGDRLSMYACRSAPADDRRAGHGPGRPAVQERGRHIRRIWPRACLSARAGWFAVGAPPAGWQEDMHIGAMWANPRWARAVVDGTSPPVYRNVAMPLDGHVVRLFADPHPDHTTVLLEQEGGAYALMTQDRPTGAWCREPIHLVPSQQAPVAVRAYRSQLTLLDESGTPVPGEVMHVTADALVQIRIGEAYCMVGPGLSQPVVTDWRGRATVVSLATGLTAPALSVTADGVANGRVVRGDARVHAYLAATGDLPMRARFSGAVLKAATVGTVPLIPAATWDKVDADQLVASIGSVYQAVSAPPGTARGGFVIQSLDPSRPMFRTLASRAELDAELAAHQANPAYAGVLEDAADYLGVLWEGVRRVGAALKNAVVRCTKGAVT